MTRLSAFAALALALAGCSGQKPQPSEFKNEKPGHGHDHDRGKFKLADAELPGGVTAHAALTAHLSKKGDHEIDVMFETMDKEPKPIPVAIEKMTARVTRKGDDKPYTLEFVPAPKDERKTDPDGKCSHFVAEAKWLKPDDELTVTLTVPVDGKMKTIPWLEFVPKKYGHDAE